MKHPLSEQTIQDVRQCVCRLVRLRERELADAAGVAKERPYYSDEKSPSTVVAPGASARWLKSDRTKLAGSWRRGPAFTGPASVSIGLSRFWTLDRASLRIASIAFRNLLLLDPAFQFRANASKSGGGNARLASRGMTCQPGAS